MKDFFGHHIIYDHQGDDQPIVFYDTANAFMRQGTLVSVENDHYSPTPKAWQPSGQAPPADPEN